MSNLKGRMMGSKDITKVGENLPSWMAEHIEGDTSFDNAKKHTILPRAKILQGLSDKAMVKEFGVGSVVLIPAKSLVAQEGQPILVTPIFTFDSYMAWNDLKDTSNPGVHSFTLDPASEVGSKARNRVVEEYGSGYSRTYVEHINVVCLVQGNSDLAGEVITLEFSRGENFTGKSWLNAMLQRKIAGQRVPLYLQQWVVATGEHKNKQGQTWYGYNYHNPEPEALYVSKEQAQICRALFEQMKEDYEANKLGVDMSDAATEPTVDVNESEM